MKLFTFRPEDHRAHYHEHDWVHVPRGAGTDFCDYVTDDLARRTNRASFELDGMSVRKDQYVLDLPESSVLVELFDTVSSVCGLDRARLTLSERHVKQYARDAVARPRPHKDRLASQVSVGVSIVVPESSYLVLWPDDERDPNPLQRAGLTETLLPERTPESTLVGRPPVTVHDSPGDVMIFAGSSIWHTRHNPAGAVVVYFKCNEFASDPLGEDPVTPQAEECSRVLASDDADLRNAFVALSRRFESTTREYALRLDAEWLNVNVTGQMPKQITEREWQVLRRVDGTATVAELLRRSNIDDVSPVVRLVELGALELRPGSARALR